MPILQEDDLTALFCSVDDFCQIALPLLRKVALATPGKRNRARSLSESEIMTLLIAFHQSQFRTFKAFYTGFACFYWHKAFPKLVSYNRFIEFVPSVLRLLNVYLCSLFGKCSGVSFLDSTALAVCHARRISQHKVFASLAKRGKTSVGWFYGFKLHLVINNNGELVNVRLTTGEVHDLHPVPTLLKGLFGKVFADKGYLSEPLRTQLAQADIELITKVRKNMKERSLSEIDEYLLGKRAIIESVIDHLKNGSQIEHTRHRARTGFVTNLLCALIAYCHAPNKPNLKLALELE